MQRETNSYEGSGLNRVTGAWWCERHLTIHELDIHAESWDHRLYLHPVFVEMREVEIPDACGAVLQLDRPDRQGLDTFTCERRKGHPDQHQEWRGLASTSWSDEDARSLPARGAAPPRHHPGPPGPGSGRGTYARGGFT